METYGLSQLRILVVDDSAYTNKITKALLEAMEVAWVRTVDSAADALVQMSGWSPDLIITDHAMEPMTGLEMIKRIRDDKDNPQRFMPIILLTGYAKAEIVTAARFDAGADAVLVKPVSAQRLFSCLVALFESERTFVRTGRYFGPDRRGLDRPFEGLNRRHGTAAVQGVGGAVAIGQAPRGTAKGTTQAGLAAQADR